MSQKRVKQTKRIIRKEAEEHSTNLQRKMLDTIKACPFKVRLWFAWDILKGEGKKPC